MANKHRSTTVGALMKRFGMAVGMVVTVSGCADWDPMKPFERNAPEVDQAIEQLKAKANRRAYVTLRDYLGTGPCSESGIGLPPKARVRANASFDLGLALFRLAEKYGARFGEEEKQNSEQPGPQGIPQKSGQPTTKDKREQHIECAQIVVQAIASDQSVPASLRARAFYLAGNLDFLRSQYKEAVKNYNDALLLVPGNNTKSKNNDSADIDTIGRDAAHNRAIALRRIEEQDKKDQDKKDQDKKDQDKKDQDKKDQPKPEQMKPPVESKAPRRSEMLDDLRQAPTYQQRQAEERARRSRRRPVMEDK